MDMALGDLGHQDRGQILAHSLSLAIESQYREEKLVPIHRLGYTVPEGVSGWGFKATVFLHELSRGLLDC